MVQEEILTSGDDYVDNTSEDENWEPPSKKSSLFNKIIISGTSTDSDSVSDSINNCNVRAGNIVISDSDNDNVETPKKRVRKRFRNVQNWKKCSKNQT